MLSWNALLLKKKVSIDRKKIRRSISFDDENYREQRCTVESQFQHTKATWLCVSLQNNCGITYLWTCMLFPNITISLTSINQRAKPYHFFMHTSPGNQQRSEKPRKAKFYIRDVACFNERIYMQTWKLLSGVWISAPHMQGIMWGSTFAPASTGMRNTYM